MDIPQSELNLFEKIGIVVPDGNFFNDNHNVFYILRNLIKKLFSPDSALEQLKTFVQNDSKSREDTGGQDSARDKFKKEICEDLRKYLQTNPPDNPNDFVDQEGRRKTKDVVSDLETKVGQITQDYTLLEQQLKITDENFKSISQNMWRMKSSNETKANLQDYVRVEEQLQKAANVQQVERLQADISTKASSTDVVALEGKVELMRRQFYDQTKSFQDIYSTIERTKEEMRGYFDDYVTTLDHETAMRAQETRITRLIKETNEIKASLLAEVEVYAVQIRAAQDDVNRKVKIEQFRQLEKFIHEEMVIKEEIVELHKAVVPKVTEFGRRVEEFAKNIDKQNLCLRRFDEIMCHKSTKVDVIGLEKRVNKKAEQDHVEEVQDQIQDQISKINRNIDADSRTVQADFRSVYDKFNEMDRRIKEVRHMAVESGAGVEMGDLQDALRRKADKDDITMLFDVKANKDVAERSMQSMEIIHSQMMNMQILTMGIITAMLDKSNEKQTKMRIKSQLERHGTLLFRWLRATDKIINATLDNDDESSPETSQYVKEIQGFNQSILDSLQELSHPQPNWQLQFGSRKHLNHKSPRGGLLNKTLRTGTDQRSNESLGKVFRASRRQLEFGTSRAALISKHSLHASSVELSSSRTIDSDVMTPSKRIKYFEFDSVKSSVNGGISNFEQDSFNKERSPTLEHRGEDSSVREGSESPMVARLVHRRKSKKGGKKSPLPPL